MAVLRAEEQAEVRVLGSQSIGPRVLARGGLKKVTGGSEGPSCSPALNERQRLMGPGDGLAAD